MVCKAHYTLMQVIKINFMILPHSYQTAVCLYLINYSVLITMMVDDNILHPRSYYHILDTVLIGS